MSDTIKTVDDVLKALDELSASVVWMDITEEQRSVIYQTLAWALKAIQAVE